MYSILRRILTLVLLAPVAPVAWAQVTIGASGITNTSASDYVITSNVTLGANQTWNALNGDIVVSGNINGNDKKLVVTGANDTTLSGVLSGLAYNNGLIKSGSGTLFLSGSNTFGGPIKVQAGTVELSNNNALGGTAWGNTVQSGGTLALSNNITVSQGSLAFSGSGSGSGSLLNVSGNNTLNASISLNADSVFGSQAGTLNLTQSISQGNRDLTLQGPGNWNVTGQVGADNGGTLYLYGDGTTTMSGSLNVKGGVVIDNNGTSTLSGDLNLDHGSLTIQGNSQATLTGGQVGAGGGLVIAGNATANISNSLNLDHGSLTISGNAQATLTGSQLNAGGGLVIAGSAQADISNSLNLDHGDISLSTSGDVNLSGSQINVGDITLSGTGSTVFDTQINADSFTQTGDGTTTFSGTGNNYFGSVSLEGGTVIANQDGVAFFTSDLSLDNVNLQFGEDSQIPAWTTVTMADNVSIFLNGTTQVWDELVITGDSVIDFGNGNGSLTIGSLLVSNDAVLTILNWGEGNTDIFNLHIDPASAQPQIVFSGGGGAVWDPITGDVTPAGVVPEPRTYGFLFMGATLAGWYARNRWRRVTGAA